MANDGKNDFLEAATVAGVGVHDFDLPVLGVRVLAIHAEQVGAEQRGFVAAGAGTDFDDSVAGIVRVGRNKAELDVAIGAFECVAEGFKFGLCKLAKFRIGNELLVLGNLFLERLPAVSVGEEFANALEFTRKVAGTALVGEDGGIGQLGFEVGGAFAEAVEIWQGVHGGKEKFVPTCAGTNLSRENSYLALA